jgi:hypothetical protein
LDGTTVASGKATKGQAMARRRRSLSSALYQAARLSSDLDSLASGNPRRVARRAKNVALGRTLARAGVWRMIWR